MRTSLFAMLLAVFAQACAQTGTPVPPPPKAPGLVLVTLATGTDPQRAMQAAYNAFARHKWAVSVDAEGALVARNRNFDIDAMLKVFIGDGALRYLDSTVDTKGRKAQVPERWLNYVRGDLHRQFAMLEQRAAKAPDPTERLRRLKSMLDAGVITQPEYESKRAEILKSL